MRLIIVALLMAIPLTVFSQNSAVKPDNRVKLALDNAQIKYDVDKKGAFSFEVNFTDNRRQTVFVESETNSVGSFETRIITSVGYASKTPLTADKQNELLAKSVVLPIGSWIIIKLNDGSYAAEFIAKVPATMDDKQLIEIINYVCSEADAVEKRFTEKMSINFPLITPTSDYLLKHINALIINQRKNLKPYPPTSDNRILKFKISESKFTAFVTEKI